MLGKNRFNYPIRICLLPNDELRTATVLQLLYVPPNISFLRGCCLPRLFGAAQKKAQRCWHRADCCVQARHSCSFEEAESQDDGEGHARRPSIAEGNRVLIARTRSSPAGSLSTKTVQAESGRRICVQDTGTRQPAGSLTTPCPLHPVH